MGRLIHLASDNPIPWEDLPAETREVHIDAGFSVYAAAIKEAYGELVTYACSDELARFAERKGIPLP
jgi:hypothetical protein